MQGFSYLFKGLFQVIMANPTVPSTFQLLYILVFFLNPGCLGYKGDDTTHLYRDYDKPLKVIRILTLNNQYNSP